MRNLLALCSVILLFSAVLLSFFSAFPRPYRDIVEKSNLSPALVYAVMKAESNFREDAVSAAGAVGIMQLLPSTAAFICRNAEIPFRPDRLTEGAYNTMLGCRYLAYLLERFEETAAVAAYNAGEGTVRQWLLDPRYSEDGTALSHIPFPETARYLKKISFFRKIYGFFPD